MNTQHERKILGIISGALKRWGETDIRKFLEGTMKLSDMQWLLSYLFEKIVDRLDVTNILSQRRSNKFVVPCNVDQRVLQHFDSLATRVLDPLFFVTELSPVSPIGSNSLLTKIQQGNVLPTSRMVEVTGDIATALAIECAVRYKHNSIDTLRIASSHRIVRLQDFSPIPGFTQHFRMFGLCTAGKREAHSVVEGAEEHIRFYLQLFDHLQSEGYAIKNISVYLSDIGLSMKMIESNNLPMEEVRRMTDYEDEYNLCAKTGHVFSHYLETVPDAALIEDTTLASSGKIVEHLRPYHPSVKFFYDLGRIAGIGYYNGLCFKIVATNMNGETFPLVDGGSSDWMAKLLQNKKTFCMSSGIGSELFCREFRG